MERVADYIVERLAQEKVGKIFLITGRGILYLTDAVAKNPDMEGISMYHEQGISYAAMAYAAAKDGLGACLVSTGCAAANAVTAALCAWQDNLPVIFLSGQHMLKETTRYTGLPLRTYGSQESDIISIVQPVTKYAVMLTDAQNVAIEMDKAITLACSGRKGPVWIDVPLDVQDMRIDPDSLPRWQPAMPAAPDLEKEAEQTARELRAAKRPLLFLGGGVRGAGACKQAAALAEKYRLPVVFSPTAADAYGTGHDLSIGAVGSLGGSRAGNFAVQNADYLLVLGSRLCSQIIGAEPERFAPGAHITAVDIDPLEHTKKGAGIDRTVIADVKDFLQALAAQDLPVIDPGWADKCCHWKKRFAVGEEPFVRAARAEGRIELYGFADTLSALLPDDATVITDAGLEELIVPAAIRYHGDQRCLFPYAQGAMGYAIPAVVGAHFAGRKNIVAVVGDGSAMMNLQELQVIRWHDIPAKILIINNNMYAVIRKRQKDLFRRRTIGNDPTDGLGAPDYAALAAAFGLPYYRIDSAGELSNALRRVLSAAGPCLCEVMCTEDQPYLHTSFAFDENRRLVKRPLEDLSPFLAREVILSEMAIPTSPERK